MFGFSKLCAIKRCLERRKNSTFPCSRGVLDPEGELIIKGICLFAGLVLSTAVWATADEHRRVATEVFGEEFMSEANAANDETLRSQNFLQDVALKDVIVEDTDESGHVIYGHASLMTKMFIDIKKKLMAAGKYSGSSMNFANSSVEVDTNSVCSF